MWYHLGIAVCAAVTLTGIWVGVQTLVRRSSPEFGPDSDVLACRTCGDHDCAGCKLARAVSAGDAK